MKVGYTGGSVTLHILQKIQVIAYVVILFYVCGLKILFINHNCLNGAR